MSNSGRGLRAIRDYLRGVFDAVIAMGCDYIQIDAPNYAMFYADLELRAFFAAQGHDLDREIVVDAEIDSSIFDGLTDRGRTRALHVCRGNAGRRWMASGGHEPIASKVYPRLTNVDTLLLEDDTPRAGDFGPLRHVRPDTTVVLGLMTTKDATLESGEAQRFVPRERLALSPQCGFASVEGGNPLTETQQEAKLRRLAEVARRVWPA